MEKSLQALNHREKIAVWSERIAAYCSSGISVRVRAWYEGNGISTASYYKWQKILFCLLRKAHRSLLRYVLHQQPKSRLRYFGEMSP